MNSIYLRLSVFLSILLLTSFFMPMAYASVSVSVTPIDGTSGIRFDRILPGLKNTKQLQVRVTSTAGKQYQVLQRVYEPMTNDKQQPLNLSSIEVATLPNSNTSGTLYMQNPEHLSYSDQLIYTSGQGGESDSFTIAYNALPELIGGNGSFRGRIDFIVSVFGSGDQVESLVDFVLENTAQLKVAVTGDHDPKGIHIKDTDTSAEKADFVKVSFSNNASEEIKIYQEFLSFLTNEAGEELPLEAIKISLQGNSSNIRQGNGSISRSRALLYSGTVNDDEFAVAFLVDADRLQEVNAGLYKGQLKYSVETSSAHQEFTIDIECQIQPVFSIEMTLPPGGVSFGHVLADSPAQEKQVWVSVRTNLHKPYQVMQGMDSLMINEHGKEFDKKYFTFKVDLAIGQKGQTKYTEFSSVETGDYPVYHSDAQGSPAKFAVTYELKGHFKMNAGNFTAPLKFSLSQD